MKRRQRRPVLELNKTQTGSHGEFLQSKDKYKQIPSDCPVQNVPANPLANLLCHYNSDSDTEDTKKDICKLDDQVNNFFKEIQLIAPKEPNPVDPNNCGVIPNAAVQSAQHLNQQGIMWRECLDESSGYPYYWHIETNEVTWEMPDELQFFKNNAKMSSAVKSTPTQDSHWVDFSSIAYQQSHENIPEGMIPREVVARNRNRYIQKETVRKQDTQTDQDAANTSDAMDDDSDDGKIEMITSYGSDESDSDTTENNQSHNEIQSVSTPESANTNTTIKVKSAEILPMLAPKSLPRVSKRSKKSNQECEKRSSIGEARIEVVLDKKLNDEKDTILRLKNQGKALKRSIDEEVLEYASKGGIEPDIVTVEENITKKHTTKKHVDSELDFRISLVPGYDEDSDPDEEPEVKEERKTLFPIPQNEDTLESVSSLHRSSILQGKQITVDDNRVTDSNDSDTNMDSVGKKNVESQDDDGSSEKLECGEESCVKMEDDAQKTNNKFLESLRGRNKCFQRKKRIAFDVPAAKIKDSDDSETTKVETEPQHGEINLRTDAEHDVELLKESHIECQKEPDNANDNTTEGIKTHLKEELNTEEQSNPQVDAPALSKDGEEEVNSLSQIILEKLKFLSEGKQSVSPVQMMAIQLQTLFVAWEGGFLEKNYLRRWLTDTGHELERLEQDAAPPGWLCQWDRSHKRYYYQNATTGVTQWTYPDTGIAGGTEEMEICSTPPPAEQEEITASVEAEKSKSKPKNSKEDDDETNGDTTDPRSSDIEAPPPPQISNPSPPPPPRIYAEDLKKDKRKRDKCGEILDNKKKRSGEETTMMMDAQQLDNPAVSAHLSTPLSPQSSTIPNINNAEPLPPGVDLTEASYEIPATALKRIIYSTVQPQGNSLYDTSPRDPAVPILGHPAAIVQEHYLQYPAYHQHLHAPAALVLPHKHGVQPAIQLIPDYTPIYANHKVIEKPPVKTAKESLVSALDSFYSDIARIESSVPEKVSQRQEISSTEASSIVVEEVKMDVEQEPVPVESTVKEKKRKKTRIGISKKHKEVSSMVAKWQKAQQNFEDNT